MIRLAISGHMTHEGQVLEEHMRAGMSIPGPLCSKAVDFQAMASL